MLESVLCLLVGAAILTVNIRGLKIGIESKKYLATTPKLAGADVVNNEGHYEVKLT